MADDLEAALAWTRRAIEAHRARGATDRTLQSQSFAGILLLDLGRPTEAAVLGRERLALARELGDAAETAAAQGDLGLVHYDLAGYGASLDLQRQALAGFEALGDGRGQANTHLNLGIVHERTGDFAKARAAYGRARRFAEQLGDPGLVALVVMNIGVVHHDPGEHAAAVARFEEALGLLDAIGDRRNAAQALLNLAVLSSQTGDDAAARRHAERALAIARGLGNPIVQSGALDVIAEVLANAGDLDGALGAREQSLALVEAGGDRDGTAATLGNLGSLLLLRGEHVRARDVLRRSLALAEEIRRRPYVVTALCVLAEVELRAGAPSAALPLADRAAREAERIRDMRGLVAALTTLAEAQLASGQAELAVATSRRAVPHLDVLVGRQSESIGASARGQVADLFAIGARAGAVLGDPVETSYFLEEGRAGGLLESLGGRELLADAVLGSETAERDRAAQILEAETTAAYRRALDGGDLRAVQEALREMKAARERRIQVVETIQRSEKASADVFYPRAAPLEEIRRHLGPEEAFVAFGLLDGDDAGDALALVANREGARIVPLGPAAEVRAAAQDLRAGDRTRDPTAAAARLRDLVVRPLGLTDSDRRIAVSPEGALSYVPLALLMRERVVQWVPSGTTLCLLSEERPTPGQGVLALGDPVYASTAAAEAAPSDPGAVRGARLVSLPGTREEALAVGDVTRLGAEASEAGLRAALALRPRWRAVHLACHGLIDTERPMLSALALSPDPEHDGLLSVLDVFRSRFPADLAVLSACETGLGPAARAEGVVGLTRAFLFAGASRVLVSLWDVDDEATRALMTRFYALWNPKDGTPPLDAASALRAAQEHVRADERWKHPAYWAAWQLWGFGP